MSVLRTPTPKTDGEMKHQYFGDINDYRKYGLLGMLVLTGDLQTGVCWMLTENEDRNEGNLREYLRDRDKYRRYDPPLFDFLSGCAVRENDPLLNRSVRNFAEMLQRFRDRDLIFFDPDIGLEIQQRARGNAGSSKYLYFCELIEAYRQDHSLLVYQHLGQRHMHREDYIQERVAQFFESLPVDTVFEFRTPYVVAFLACQPRHKDSFSQRRFVIGNSTWATEGQIVVRSHQHP